MNTNHHQHQNDYLLDRLEYSPNNSGSLYFESNQSVKTEDTGNDHVAKIPTIVSPPSSSNTSSSQTHSSSSDYISKGSKQLLKKNAAHHPPSPPKTAFMCFSDATTNGDNISKEVGNNNLKLVAERWRLLSPKEKAVWEEQSRQDKRRYIKAKTDFIPTPDSIPKRRAKKHPLAPKRPMSAFLKYSLSRRKSVKADNPDMNNTDISRLLGEMWRNACEQEKRPYIEKELKERATYKAEIARWRLIQQRKEMDEALNETTRVSPISIVNSTKNCATFEDSSCLSNDDKVQELTNQSIPPIIHRDNGIGEHENYNCPPIFERRENITFHACNEEPPPGFRYFQEIPYNHRPNNYAHGMHHSYSPSIERTSDYHGPDYYHNDNNYQFKQGNQEEERRNRFDDRTMPTPHSQQYREQYSQHTYEEYQPTWENHYHQYR